VKPIVIVTNSLTGGGAERSMNLLASHLSKFSDSQIFLIPINSGPRDLVDPQCNVVEIQRTWRGSLWDSIRSFMRFQLALQRIRPGVLIINCDLSELYSAFSLWSSKSIIVEHTTRPWNGREHLGNLIRLILRIRGAGLVRVSDKIHPNLKFKHQDVIRNIIDPQIFKSNTDPNFRENRSGKLVFIGRLSKEKRPDLFIQIARETALRAVVIGDGVLRVPLEDSSRNLGNVNFVGQRNNPWENLSNDDLVVVTSEFEGDGLVALEAAAIGIPVVLRSTSDLKALGFPQKNYFQSSIELTKRLAGTKFSSFALKDSEAERILKGRQPKDVALQWLRFISTL
jgi:glycosyltransferase involved in cell wall biosynthesis